LDPDHASVPGDEETDDEDNEENSNDEDDYDSTDDTYTTILATSDCYESSDEESIVDPPRCFTRPARMSTGGIAPPKQLATRGRWHGPLGRQTHYDKPITAMTLVTKEMNPATVN
jgi:hypothetical protein